MQFENAIGIMSGVLTSVSMLPQFFKLIKTKASQNISIGMLLVLLIGVAGWTYYGFLRKDSIISATNAFASLINLLTVILSVRYRKHNSPG